MFSYIMSVSMSLFFFFFNDTATTEIYTLSLHDALPIWAPSGLSLFRRNRIITEKARRPWARARNENGNARRTRSEEHTSELQSLAYLVCRLLLEKKKNKIETI